MEQYQYILNEVPPLKHDTGKKFVWQYWGQGAENAPNIVKACFASVKEYCPDCEIVVLNDDNIGEYITIPEFITEKLKSKVITRTHFSDYLRTALLYEYGGIWIDATVLLTGEIPENVRNSDFFVFKTPPFAEYGKIPSKKLLKLLDFAPRTAPVVVCLSNWFIVSKPGNHLLYLTKSILSAYWEKETKLLDYFIYHYIVTFIILNNKICSDIFEKMPNICNLNPHLLQQILNRDFDEELFKELKTLSSIHKLTYKNKTENPNSFLHKILSNIRSKKSIRK